MRKNGFTLIELLAVIVILAIIALIATPIILGIINDAREKANERSVELYASAVKNAIAAYQLTGQNEPKSFSDLDIQYDGDVKCSVQELYSDGSFYLEGCTVNGGEKTYNYGTKQESDIAKVCTRQNDEEGFDTVTCTIGENTESFYVMNSYLTDVPSDKIVMMTKYNIDATTYRQSSSAGMVVFSNTNYWSSETTYPVDVYDERNDIIEPVIDGYVKYLNQKLNSVQGGLLTYSQATLLGCDISVGNCSSEEINGGPAANPAPKWVYSTSYWLGSADTKDSVYYIFSVGAISSEYYGEPEDLVNDYGVRPVITISTNEIQ